MDDKTSDKMSIEDAIRLKKELNKGISYGGSGHNAKQFQEAEGLTQNQHVSFLSMD